MSDLTYAGENKVESIPLDHTIVLSFKESVGLACTLCGGFKLLINYKSKSEYIVLNDAHVCTCNYARNSGGDYYNFDHAANELEREQARVLVALWPCDNIYTLRDRLCVIDGTRYTADYKQLLKRLFDADDLDQAQRLILQYAAAHEVA